MIHLLPNHLRAEIDSHSSLLGFPLPISDPPALSGGTGREGVEPAVNRLANLISSVFSGCAQAAIILLYADL